MRNSVLLTIIFSMLTISARCQILSYRPNLTDSSSNYLFLSRSGAMKALTYKSELNVCKTDLSITEQILDISRRQTRDYSTRLDSLTTSTAQTRIENKGLKDVNLVLTRKKNNSKLENWLWRIGVAVGGYLLLK